MTAVEASVVIVSRHRPRALLRCVTGVGQLYHPSFEIVAVADPAGLAVLDQAGWAGRIKMAAFDEANLSAARNKGIALAAGEVVAFIDDDAVPEPTWLDHLTAPFAAPHIGAAGGFVRARNGISFQWKARDVRSDGQSHPIKVDESVPTVLTGRSGTGIKTEGTNMAFRRRVLVAQRGFDPAFRFYLDETDLNLRLADMSVSTAIVPLAQVHHGFAPSARRRSDRVPRDLSDIGASLAVFLRKHNPDGLADRHSAEHRAQRARLVTHMVAGRIEPRDVGRILATFDDGWQSGMTREFGKTDKIGPASAPFLRYVPRLDTGQHHVLSAWSRGASAARAKAAALVAVGNRVSLYVFSADTRFHRVSFDPQGFWVQTGGLFGRSDRSGPLFRRWRFNDRLNSEVDRDRPFRTRKV